MMNNRGQHTSQSAFPIQCLPILDAKGIHDKDVVDENFPAAYRHWRICVDSLILNTNPDGFQHIKDEQQRYIGHIMLCSVGPKLWTVLERRQGMWFDLEPETSLKGLLKSFYQVKAHPNNPVWLLDELDKVYSEADRDRREPRDRY